MKIPVEGLNMYFVRKNTKQKTNGLIVYYNKRTKVAYKCHTIELRQECRP